MKETKKSKLCKICALVKPISEYYTKTASYCKVCSNEKAKEWQKANKDKYNAQKRLKYKTDEQFRIAHYNRCVIRDIINNKSKHYRFLVECGAGSRREFMEHLMSTIPEGYTIDDYGTNKYEGKLCVDHIVPCSKFDLTDRDQYLECFNYKNLRLITKKHNAKKYNK